MTADQIQDAVFDFATSISETGPIRAALHAANSKEVIDFIEQKNELTKQAAIQRQLARLAAR
jgi:hypothetical protein